MCSTLFADFNDLSEYPGAGISQGISLGLEEDIPALQGLTEHDQVILDMPGELQAEGYVTRRSILQGHCWYAIVTGPIRYYDEVLLGVQGSQTDVSI